MVSQHHAQSNKGACLAVALIICCWRLCTHTLQIGFAAANGIASTIAMGVFSYRQIILLLLSLLPPPLPSPTFLLLFSLLPSSSPLPHPPLFPPLPNLPPPILPASFLLSSPSPSPLPSPPSPSSLASPE